MKETSTHRPRRTPGQRPGARQGRAGDESCPGAPTASHMSGLCHGRPDRLTYRSTRRRDVCDDLSDNSSNAECFQTESACIANSWKRFRTRSPGSPHTGLAQSALTPCCTNVDKIRSMSWSANRRRLARNIRHWSVPGRSDRTSAQIRSLSCCCPFDRDNAAQLKRLPRQDRSPEASGISAVKPKKTAREGTLSRYETELEGCMKSPAFTCPSIITLGSH